MHHFTALWTFNCLKLIVEAALVFSYQFHCDPLSSLSSGLLSRHLFPLVYLPVCLSFCLSVCLSVGPPVSYCFSFCDSVTLRVCGKDFMSWISIHTLSIYLSLCLFVCVCPSVFLSVPLWPCTFVWRILWIRFPGTLSLHFKHICLSDCVCFKELFYMINNLHSICLSVCLSAWLSLTALVQFLSLFLKSGIHLDVYRRNLHRLRGICNALILLTLFLTCSFFLPLSSLFRDPT